jgi:hypothetical protein
MHPWRPWIALVALAAFAGQAAVVYKWTDAKGLIHYSDQPVPGAQRIYTTSSSMGTVAPPGSTAESPPSVVQRDAPVLGYTEFAIASPQPNQTFFGDEVITVSLSLDPSLRQNHVLTWRLNGQELQDQGPNAAQFDLPHLDLNTYILNATITDPQTGDSRSTDSVTFFVHQPSALSPQHKRP